MEGVEADVLRVEAEVIQKLPIPHPCLGQLDASAGVCRYTKVDSRDDLIKFFAMICYFCIYDEVL